jgi:MoxR-like ATPase
MNIITRYKVSETFRAALESTHNPVICIIEQNPNDLSYSAIDKNGNRNTDISEQWMSTAFKNKLAMAQAMGSAGKLYWRPIEQEYFTNDNMLGRPKASSVMPTKARTEPKFSDEHNELLTYIHSSYKLKPKKLVMNELKWKYLVRSAVRGKNILMTGPAGCGKTMAARELVKALDRPDFYFNMGATQDPRASLIGNVHFNKESGTYFTESTFVKAIQTPNAIILMDELSRAHPDAWNILMTVLDEGQRYLRLDEAEGQAVIKVAKGVTFIATANVGNEYTSTRVMDRALLDRFTKIEMDVLSQDQEANLLMDLYPLVDSTTINNLSELSSITRLESSNDDGKLTNHVSTRTSVETASLLYDGFSLIEASQVTILPIFDASGGLESERTYVNQILQKYAVDETQSDDLFTDVDMRNG